MSESEGFFSKLKLHRKKAKDSDINHDIKVLPQSVRYALEYRQGNIGKEEVTHLLKAGFEDEALYLSMRALNRFDNRAVSLQKYLTLLLRNAQEHIGYSDVISDAVENIPNGIEIQAKKLAQISRVGFESWHKKFEEFADESVQSQKVPVLIAFASMTGLTAYLDRIDQIPEMQIIIPSWVSDPHDGLCGFRIQSGENSSVQPLDKNYTRPTSFMIVDDARRTGSQLGIIENFWFSNNETHFDNSSLHLISDLKQNPDVVV